MRPNVHPEIDAFIDQLHPKDQGDLRGKRSWLVEGVREELPDMVPIVAVLGGMFIKAGASDEGIAVALDTAVFFSGSRPGTRVYISRDGVREVRGRPVLLRRTYEMAFVTTEEEFLFHIGRHATSGQTFHAALTDAWEELRHA